MELDRRSFLRNVIGAAGAVVLGSCARSSSPDGGPSPARPTTTLELLSPDQLPPRARPTLRLGTRNYGAPAPFSYLPPAYGHMLLIYDTLLSFDAAGRRVPWLATSYQPSPDGLTHAFELRDNARWHDGRPVTAADVVFTFEYFEAQRSQGKIAPFVLFRPEYVQQVRAKGSRSVEFRLEKPAVTFPTSVAARLPIVPAHIWSSITQVREAEVNLEKLVGSGPYRLEAYNAGKAGLYLFTANDEFFLGKPFVKRIEMLDVGDELAALRAGQIDAGGFEAQATNARALDPFRDDPSFGVLDGPPDFVTALQWNQGRGGALADVRFRRACAHAINRQDMVRRLLGGNGIPGNPGFLIPGHPFHVEVEQYPYDPAAANRLLDEAGYRRTGSSGPRRGPNGEPLRFTLSAPPTIVSAVEFVVNALKRVGIELEIEPVNTPFGIGDNYEMAMVFYGGMNEDPDYLRRVYSSRVDKLFMAARGYTNPEVDDLAERQLVTLDEVERRRQIERIQQLVSADLPVLHLYYPNSFLVFKKSVIDQVALNREGGGLTKPAFVTGAATGGTTIRPSP